MTARGTITRAALAVALVALAGAFIWVGATRATNAQPGAAIPSLLLALVPLVAAGLLFARPGVGTTLAIVAALLGAGEAFALNFCLCPMPALSPEFVALYVAAAVVLALALVQLVTLGLAWFAMTIVVAFLALLGPVGILAAGLLIAAVVAWRMFRRRRSKSGASANGR